MDQIPGAVHSVGREDDELAGGFEFWFRSRNVLDIFQTMTQTTVINTAGITKTITQCKMPVINVFSRVAMKFVTTSSQFGLYMYKYRASADFCPGLVENRIRHGIRLWSWPPCT